MAGKSNSLMLQNGHRKEGSRNKKQRNLDERKFNGNGNAYISSSDMGAIGISSRGVNDFKMSRNESKNSTNFNKEQIKNQQNRLMRMNNDNYIMESPDSHRKVNNKVGV